MTTPQQARRVVTPRPRGYPRRRHGPRRARMPVGEHVPDHVLRGRPHGVVVWRDAMVTWCHATRTRRGAGRSYRDLVDWLPVDPARAEAAPGEELVVARVERRRVVDERIVRALGDPPPDAGTREPRRPRPSSAGGAALVERPDD